MNRHHRTTALAATTFVNVELVPAPTPPPPTAPPVVTPAPVANCHPSYSPCLPIVADLDCPDVRALGAARRSR